MTWKLELSTGCWRLNPGRLKEVEALGAVELPPVEMDDTLKVGPPTGFE